MSNATATDTETDVATQDVAAPVECACANCSTPVTRAHTLEFATGRGATALDDTVEERRVCRRCYWEERIALEMTSGGFFGMFCLFISGAVSRWEFWGVLFG